MLNVSQNSNAQTFKNNWQNFAIKNWTIELSSDTAQIFKGFYSVGRIEIKNNNDSTITTSFVVFDRSVALTSKFSKAMVNWLRMQSCVSPRKENIQNFFYGNYFYFIVPCMDCFYESKDDTDCIELMKYIKSNYINKPKNKTTTCENK